LVQVSHEIDRDNQKDDAQIFSLRSKTTASVTAVLFTAKNVSTETAVGTGRGENVVSENRPPSAAKTSEAAATDRDIWKTLNAILNGGFFRMKDSTMNIEAPATAAAHPVSRRRYDARNGMKATED